MKSIKNFISLFLVVIMITSTILITPVQGVQAETTTFTSVTDEDPVSIEGENTLGNMLADKIRSDYDEQNVSQNIISDVSIDGKTALVSYSSQISCIIMVGLYQEGTGRLLTSAQGVADVNKELITLTFNCEQMPESFVVKAFILDEKKRPLSEEYVSTLYTKTVQEVKSITADDFQEEQVLNLDNDNETNFMVYNDETIVIDCIEGQNILESYNSENGIYIFTSANDQLKNLHNGDMFSYRYNDDVIVAKVQKIDVDGDTVTISEKEATLEDAFDYIKIEGSESDCEAYIDSSNMDDGVSFEGVYEEETNNDGGLVSVGSSNGIRVNENFDKSFTVFDYKKDWTINGVSVSLTGSSVLKLNISLDMYYKFSDRDNFYLNTSFKYTMDNNVSINAKLPERKINLAQFAVTFFKVVTLKFKPSVVFSANANVSYQITIEGKIGIKCNKTSGLQKIYEKPIITKNELKFHGEIYIGLELKPSINIISESIANAYINARFGVRVTADYSSINSDPQHLCKNCINGKINFNIYLGANVGFFMNPVTKKYIFEFNKDSAGNSLLNKDYLLSNFYYSFDKGEFGFTTCPNRIKNRFPQCVAQNAYWDVTTDGTLTISGTGGVEYSGAENGANSYKTRPWNVSSIKKVVIKEGITKISALFYKFSSLKTVKLPKSLKYIGNTTFNRCSSLTTIEIPSNVTYIGSGAFFMCTNLRSIKLPKGLTTVKSDMFYHCDQLSSVILSSNTKIIENKAFSSCGNLTSISLPDTITTIGDHAFLGTGLVSVSVPSSVSRLNYSVFAFCPDLKRIFIPKSVKYVTMCAFQNTKKLTDVYYAGTKSEWNNIVIEGYDNEYLKNATKHYNVSKSVISVGNGDESNNTEIAETTDLSYKGDGTITVSDGEVLFSINNLVPKENYLLIALERNSEPEVLDDSCIQYISQISSDENGAIDTTFLTKDTTEIDVYVYGPKYIDNSLIDAKAYDLVLNKSSIMPGVYVSYNGEELINGIDYYIDTNSIIANSPGEYEVTIHSKLYVFDDISVSFSVYNLGDVNKDNRVNVSDTTCIQKLLAEIISQECVFSDCADVNEDGDISVRDAVLLQKQITKIMDDSEEY